MLRSMTGYGAASSTVGAVALSVTLRAVNHRHVQVKSRLASELLALEGEVDKRVRARVARGSVGVHVNVERAPGSAPVQVDATLAATYARSLRELADTLDVDDTIDLRTLVGLPGVLSTADTSGDTEDLAAVLFATLDEALTALLEMRAVEGRAIEADLRTNLAALREIAGRVAERMPEVVRAHRDALRKRVDELLGEARVTEADLAREIAVLADRLDVSEELTRLDSHLDQFDALLAGAADDSVGRKLDFLCQELFREINTLGSKCNDATVAHWVVDAKTHAERLREQVQNVE